MRARAELLGLLPAEAAAAIALAEATDERDEKRAILCEVRELVGLAPFPRRLRVTRYPLASELTPAQRAFVELAVMGQWPHDAALPPGRALGRYIGVHSPSVLEKPISFRGRTLPVWRVLMEGAPRATVLAKLSTPEKLELYAAYCGPVWAYGIPLDDRAVWRSRVARGLARDCEAWARAQLDEEAEARAASDALGQRVERSAEVAFFALVRAGARIEPAWDHCIPLAPSVPRWAVLECAGALPLARLERAAVTRLSRFEHGRGATIRRGFTLLRAFDARVIADAVVVWIGALPAGERAEARSALARIARRQPSVSAAMGAASSE